MSDALTAILMLLCVLAGLFCAYTAEQKTGSDVGKWRGYTAMCGVGFIAIYLLA